MHDHPSALGNQPPADEPKLESWGEIASYLRRDIRTVQRWEKEQGLPVRRLLIGKQGQVYAYRTELDRWVLDRQPKPTSDEPKSAAESPTPVEITNIEFSDNDDESFLEYFKRWKLLAGFGSALVVAALLYIYIGVPAISRQPRKTLLYVRPFSTVNSNEKEFVDGLTGEMIAQLGRVDPTLIGVFAPTTSKELESKSIPDLKRILNADFVLEGNIQREQDQIRINVNLVSTADQIPAWANSYTGDLHNVLRFQDDVTNDVAQHIVLTLPYKNTRGVPSKIPTNDSTPPPLPATRSDLSAPGVLVRSSNATGMDPQLYEAYLEGRVYLLDRDFPRSMAAFERALQRDAEYPPALAGRAMSTLLLGETPNDAIRPTIALPKARQDAYKALSLNPNLSDAYCVLANVAQVYDHDLGEAERLYKKAIELDANNVTALKWYGDYLFVTNRLTEARDQIKKALDLDPASPLLNTAMAEVSYYQRDFDPGLAQAQRTVEQYPDFALARFWLASLYREKKMYPEAIREFDKLRKAIPGNSAMLMTYGHALALSGDAAEARKVLSELLRKSQTQYVPATYIAGMYSGLGDLNKAFQYLDQGYTEKNDRIVYLGVDPIADPLRADQRFSKLMKKVGLR